MKKTILCISAVLLLVAGCTSKEQDEQIKAFWTEHLGKQLPQTSINTNDIMSALKGHNETSELTEEQLQEELNKLAETSNGENNPQKQPSQTAAPAKTAPVKRARPVKAMLFVSPSCPRCQRLRRDHWVSAFENKYAGKVNLTEYDLSIPQNHDLLHEMMRKHNLSQVQYPTLFIDGHVVQGYPLNADPVVERVLSKYGLNKTNTKPYIKITMEEPIKNIVNTKASAQDKQAMQTAFAQMQTNNTNTLKDIKRMFGTETEIQASEIIRSTERTLKSKMGTSPTYDAYQKAQTSALKAQEKKLTELMQRNAGSIRSI